MFSLLVAATLTQAAAAPTVALYNRPAPGAPPRRLDAIVEIVRLELEKSGVPVSLLPRDVTIRLEGTSAKGCIRGLECLFQISRVLQVDALVALEATEFEGDVAISLEAVLPAQERRVARTSFVVEAQELDTALAPQVQPFAAEVAATLRRDVPRATPPPIDPGPPLVLEPAPPSDGADLTAPAPSPRSPVPAWVAAGGAVATGVAAVAFGVSGLQHRAKVMERIPGTDQSPYTWAEVSRSSQLANRNLTLSLTSVGLTAALTTAAILLWPESPPPASPQAQVPVPSP